MISAVTRFGDERLATDAGNVPERFPQTRAGTLSVPDALLVLADKSGSDRYTALKALEPKLDAPLRVRDIVALAGASFNSFYARNIRLLEPTWPPLMSARDALDIVQGLEGNGRLSLLNSLHPYLQSNISASNLAGLAGPTNSSYYARIVVQSAFRASSTISPEESTSLLADATGSDRHSMIRMLAPRLPFVVQPDDIVRMAGSLGDSYFYRNISVLSQRLPTRISVAEYESLLGSTTGNTRKNLERKIMEHVETIDR